MTVDRQRARSIFLTAIEDKTPADWPEFLKQECGDDSQLQKRVEALLRADQEADSLLDDSDSRSQATLAYQPQAEIGTQIGPYKLLQQIGEGGMGSVFMAEQTEPVQRKVALKLIKAGMDSRQVIARFEAERQALALMDHPNIAKVLDAGTASSGLPYFVMELVKGVPITKYCDEHHLTPQQRLELFIPVCQAIQHAHQKGIIHRDLKPSNVLVALYDSRPVPKVIDFGIAKATGQKLTERTMYTEFGAIVGTLEYMSPEQAESNQLDIDTRSDIYSLGVLLYELLTGSTPFEKKWLKDAALLEMLRIIREDEPQKPSTRLSTTDELPSISANRGLEPKKLNDQVRGELDWIVMKALEKDRAQRYETANGFALDIQRYLANEPVSACPPSAAYRFRKFLRRNTRAVSVAVTAAGSAVAALILTIALLATHSVRIQEEQTKTDKEYQRAEGALGEANRNLNRADQNLNLALEALDDLCLKDMENRVFRERQISAAERESLQRGLAFYERFAEQNSGHAALQGVMAKANLRAGFLRLHLKDWEEAQSHLSKAMPVLEKLADESAGSASNRWELARCCFGLYEVLMKTGHHREAELSCRRASNLFRKLAAEFPRETNYRVELGHSLWQLGVMDLDAGLTSTERRMERETVAREALSVFERLMAEHPTNQYYRQETAVSHRFLSLITSNLGRLEEAADSRRRAIAIYGKLVAESPTHTFYRQEFAYTWMDLGALLVNDQKFPEAEAAYRQSIAGYTQLVGEFNSERDRWGLASACWHLSQLRKRAGQLDETAELLRVAVGIWDKLGTEFDNPEHRNCWGITQTELTYVLFERSREVEQEASRSPAERQTAARTYREEAIGLMLNAMTGRAHFVARSNLADYPLSGALLAESLVQVAQKAGANRLELSRVMHWFGLAYLKRQKHAEAEPLFSACLSIREQEEPNAWMTFDTRVRLGEALLGQQKYAEAEPFLLQGYDGLILHEAQITAEEKLILSDAVNLLVELYDTTGETLKADRWRRVQAPQNATALLFDRGSRHARTGKWAQAITEYNQVLDIEPHHLAARKGRAELFLNIGLLSEAAVENTQVFPLEEPADSMVFLQHALLCRWKEDGPGYRKACELMLARFADSTDAEDWGRIVIVLGYAPESVVEPSHTVSFAARAAGHGKTVWRMAYLGLAYFRAGQFDRAAAALEDSLRIDPKWSPAIVFAIQGMVQHRLGNVMQASAALDNASSARDAYLEAMLAKEIGFWPAPWWDVVHAELLFREAYGLIRGSPPPEDGRLLILRGRALGAILRFDAAIGAFDKAIESKPEAGEAWSGRALVLFHQQQWKRAVADFTRAIELAPEVHTNWWHRAHAHANLFHWDKAADDFGHVVNHWPDGAEGWYRRGVALANSNQPEKALSDIRKGISKGFPPLDWIKNDSNLDPLRTREDFQKLLRDFEQQEKSKVK